MDVRDLSGRSALVTGAASGIGRATALLCARRGARLFLCDIDEEGLEKTAAEARALGGDVSTQRVDVASAEEMARFADAVHARVPAVDLLVNNAGVAIGAGLLETSLEDWNWILGVNLRGVIHGCHAFVPAMVRHGGGGHVVIVSSMAGYTASEALLAYCTTKYAVLGLAESLHQELRRHGVGVTAVCPGMIDTPITEHSLARGIYADPRARQDVRELYRRRAYTPERVARAMLRAVGRDRVVAPVSAEAWVLYYLKRWAPWLVRRIEAAGAARSRHSYHAPAANGDS